MSNFASSIALLQSNVWVSLPLFVGTLYVVLNFFLSLHQSLSWLFFSCLFSYSS